MKCFMGIATQSFCAHQASWSDWTPGDWDTLSRLGFPVYLYEVARQVSFWSAVLPELNLAGKGFTAARDATMRLFLANDLKAVKDFSRASWCRSTTAPCPSAFLQSRCWGQRPGGLQQICIPVSFSELKSSVASDFWALRPPHVKTSYDEVFSGDMVGLAKTLVTRGIFSQYKGTLERDLAAYVNAESVESLTSGQGARNECLPSIRQGYNVLTMAYGVTRRAERCTWKAETDLGWTLRGV